MRQRLRELGYAVGRFPTGRLNGLMRSVAQDVGGWPLRFSHFPIQRLRAHEHAHSHGDYVHSRAHARQHTQRR